MKFTYAQKVNFLDNLLHHYHFETAVKHPVVLGTESNKRLTQVMKDIVETSDITIDTYKGVCEALLASGVPSDEKLARGLGNLLEHDFKEDENLAEIAFYATLGNITKNNTDTKVIRQCMFALVSEGEYRPLYHEGPIFKLEDVLTIVPSKFKKRTKELIDIYKSNKGESVGSPDTQPTVKAISTDPLA